MRRHHRKPGKPIPAPVGRVTLKSYCRTVSRGTGKFPVSKESHHRGIGAMLLLSVAFLFAGIRARLSWRLKTPNPTHQSEAVPFLLTGNGG